jgi:hypothetical protein
MVSFRKEMRSQEGEGTLVIPEHVGMTKVKRPKAGKAAKNQGNAFATIKAMKKSMKRSLSEASLASSMSIDNDSISSNTTGSQRALSEEQLLAKDRELVDEELARYFGDGIIEDQDELDDFDIVNYWNVSYIIAFVIRANLTNV